MNSVIMITRYSMRVVETFEVTINDHPVERVWFSGLFKGELWVLYKKQVNA